MMTHLPGHSFRRLTLVVFLAALLVRLAYLGAAALWAPEGWFSAVDTTSYIADARRIMADEYLPITGDRPYHFERTPPFPAMLALVWSVIPGTEPLWPVLLLNAALGALWAVLCIKFAEQLFRGSLVVPIAGALAAANIASVAQTAFVLTDSLAVTLLLLGIVGAFHAVNRGSPWPGAASGLALGIATLTRPSLAVYILLIPVGALVTLKSRQSLRGAVLAVMAALITATAPVATWIGYVHHQTGLWTTSTKTSMAIRWYFATGVEAHGIIRHQQELIERGISTADRVGPETTARELHEFHRAAADSVVGEHRDGIVPYLALTYLRAIGATGFWSVEDAFHFDSEGFIVVGKALGSVWSLLALGGVWVLVRERAWGPLAIAAGIYLFALGPTAVSNIHGARLLLPGVPGTIVLVAVFGDRIARRFWPGFAERAWVRLVSGS